MRAHRRFIAHLLCAVLVMFGVVATSAPANTGFPKIHPPKLYVEPGEFGDTVELYIGNSNYATVVRACVTGHCRRVYSDNHRYLYTGRLFGVTLRPGQWRTVKLTASNGRSRSQWGPARVLVRAR